MALGEGGFVVYGEGASGDFARSVSAAGDVNGDGLADLIVGASYVNVRAGRSYVIFGNTTGAFSQSAVDQLGTSGNDTQSDNGTAKTLVAGAGDDVLTATAASVLYGGAGKDTFNIDQAMITALQSSLGSGGNTGQLARIDGGGGLDTIVLSGSGLTLDLTQIANQAASIPVGGSRIDSIEVIDLTGTGNNTLTLAARDVLEMAQLLVKGDAGDELNATGIWFKGGTITQDGQTYEIYRALGSAAQMLVDTDITRNVTEPQLPVELSAISAGVGGFAINSSGTSISSGLSVSAAGDVNGDGLTDLIVGAPNYSHSYVVFGKTVNDAMNLSALGTGGFEINGDSSSQSGTSVSAAGDVNGDGLADLIVGAPGKNVSYVVFGKTSSAAVNLTALGTGGFQLKDEDFSVSGYSVSAAGDVNADGLADLIVGAYGVNDGAGRSYVVFGKTSSSAMNLSALGTGGFVINGGSTDINAGWSVSDAGDVNGDGLADLIVGAPLSNRSYVVFGKTATTAVDLSPSVTGGFVINGDSASFNSGFSVSAAGDVNGDGLADLIVGASQADTYVDVGQVNVSYGRSYVVFGQSTTVAINLSAVATGVGGFVIKGFDAARLSGYSVSAAGDVNGDGLTDLIVAAPGTNRSFVVFGRSTSDAIDLEAVSMGLGGFLINGVGVWDSSDLSVSAAGDVNGDGLADLMLGASQADGGNGRSYVIFGKTTGAFKQTAVDWQGTPGNDTQSDGGVAKTLVAGAGDDVLTATAASVLYGGAGKDAFNIDQAMITALQSPLGSGGNTGQLARIDGGGGLDTLALTGSGLTLDLTQVANQAASNPDGGSRIDSVEVIDLTGSGNNALKLKVSDVLDMGSANLFQTTGRQQLLVKGNAGDTVDLADAAGTTGWTQALANATIDSASYQVWNHTSLATVYVQTGVLVG